MQRTVLVLLAVLTLVLWASTGSTYSSSGLAGYTARLKSVTLDGSATSPEYTHMDAISLLGKTDNGQTTMYRYDAVGNLRNVQLPSGGLQGP